VESPGAFLHTVAIALGAAGLTTALCRRLRLPLIFGYLLAGLVVGPHVLSPLAADPRIVRQTAELGVVLLMFSVGLGFGVRHLVRAGLGASLAATVEVALTAWLGYLAGRLVGWGTVESVFCAACVAVSSTMVVAKTFAEQEGKGEHEPIVLAILVVEDLCAVVLLAVLTAVGHGAALDARRLLVTGGRLAALFVALVVAGALVIPRLVRGAARLRDPEALLMVGVGLCFLMALAADRAGFSAALGAFLAGSLMAESGAGHKLAELVRPLRDVFAGLFFVAVGMLIDPATAVRHAPLAALLAAVLVAGKLIGVSAGVFLAGHGIRRAVPAALTMAQIGEFSILIAGIGLSTAAVSDALFVSVVVVAALTSVTTPWLVRRSEWVALWIEHHLPRPLQTFGSLYGSWIERLRGASPAPVRRRMMRGAAFLALDALLVAAICVGAAVEAPVLIDWLATRGASPRAARAGIVAVAALAALPLLWGVVRRASALARAIGEAALPPAPPGQTDLGAAPRRALVLAVHTTIALAVGVPLVALTQPFLPPSASAALVACGLGALFVAFWRGAANLQGHVRAGAEVVLEALASQTRTKAPSLEGAAHVLPGIGSLVPLRVEPTSPAVGRSLGELDLRARTGATVLAIFRAAHNVVAPAASERLLADDVLALTGSSEAVDAACRLLGEPPPSDVPPPDRTPLDGVRGHEES
jgi:CPA2 family monovalent cation:H+ antiporter-2